MRYRILTSHLPFVSVQRQNGEGCASGSRFLNFSRFAPTHTSSCRPLARHHYHTACSSGSDAAASNIPEKAGNGPELDTAGNTANTEEGNSVLDGIKRWWRRIQSPELRQKLVSLGPAAVLAYGKLTGKCAISAF